MRKSSRLDLGSSTLLFANTNGLGTARPGTPLPASLGAGQPFAFQHGFVDACGPQGFAASDALSC